MEAILQEHNNTMPAREILVALAEKFSNSPERKGRMLVQMKQVWNWFQNKRYSIRAKSTKPPGKLTISPTFRDDSNPMRNMPQPMAASVAASIAAPTVTSVGCAPSDTSILEFEAKSSRDGAWYDVATFLTHRHLETGNPEVLVRFSGFGVDEDEWINIRQHVRQRSLPCEASECVAVLPGDVILCFQEGKEQALYFDAQVLDAQRRRHDARGCRCRFLVRYLHDDSEEIVPLRKVCRRPETDYRLQQLHAATAKDLAAQQHLQKASGESLTGNPQVQQSMVPETMPKHQISLSTVPPVAPAPQHVNIAFSTGPANSTSNLGGSAPVSGAASGGWGEKAQQGVE
ncbi:hypothetical protein CDL15_Pgr002393 [Punica granatum]|nr:hypothetical protein CDL15_Pgr002393 [Punica granatum]